MAYGNQFMGGAYHSDNYNPERSPTVGRRPDPVLQQIRELASRVASETAYMTPGGDLQHYLYDPINGSYRLVGKPVVDIRKV